MPPQPRIVIPGDQPAQLQGSTHLDSLRSVADVVLYDSRPDSDEEKIRRVADAELMINSRGAVQWPGSVLKQLPKLRFISVCGIGTDAIDLEVAREQNIVVSNIPGMTAPVVAEHAFALMLATAKRMAFQTAEMKSGRWTRMDNIYLRGKTLGIVGTGPIGAAMASLGRTLGMDVVAWTFHPTDQRAEELGVRFVDLDTLLKTSDVVSLHLKLTDQSHHLMNHEKFSIMKPGSILINTARGGIVNTDALIESLDSGHLAGAGLDVYDVEPLPADHPLLQCQRVVLCPHNADQTPEGNDILNAGAVGNVLAFLEGEPRNVVT